MRLSSRHASFRRRRPGVFHILVVGRRPASGGAHRDSKTIQNIFSNNSHLRLSVLGRCRMSSRTFIFRSVTSLTSPDGRNPDEDDAVKSSRRFRRTGARGSARSAACNSEDASTTVLGPRPGVAFPLFFSIKNPNSKKNMPSISLTPFPIRTDRFARTGSYDR